MDQTPVDRMFEDFTRNVKILNTTEEISVVTSVQDIFRKSILLAAASSFESKLSAYVLSFCQEVAGGNLLISALVNNKAINRQYHSWFEWKSNNANKFFSLFGDGFKRHMAVVCTRDPDLLLSIEKFMEIGRDRNRLVHNDFGSFSMEKTTEEIYVSYKQAQKFVEVIPTELRACSIVKLDS